MYAHKKEKNLNYAVILRRRSTFWMFRLFVSLFADMSTRPKTGELELQ